MTAGAQRPQQRSVVLVSPDDDLRNRVAERLTLLHWTVEHAAGGAEALGLMGVAPMEALVVDHWLPDLQPGEFLEYVSSLYPATDLLHMDGSPCNLGQARSVRHNELAHVLRTAADEAAARVEHAAPGAPRRAEARAARPEIAVAAEVQPSPDRAAPNPETGSATATMSRVADPMALADLPTAVMLLPDVVGNTPALHELSRMVRLVAPHIATVLVLGETGTGKELVARAVHGLSARAAKPFVVLNCAAIPEHLLEAELFGHTRGAFTGAVASRMGRIEAAHGGTLFLDEIGEMPLTLQSKMLRFLENGEVQRVGDNESARVDVRIVAATHQPLLQHAEERRFRLDLYHRLAVFPVDLPALRDRADDIPMLVGHLLAAHAGQAASKAITQGALDCLLSYHWQGNVRELGHVVHRAVILAGDSAVIGEEHVRMRGTPRA